MNATGTVRYALPSQAIERVSGVEREAFEKTYLTGVGRPVIVTDATAVWPAMSKWSFDFFSARYGEEEVVVTDRLGQARVGRRVALKEYLVYAQFPNLTRLAGVESETPLYLTSFSPFARHKELLLDFDEPYCVDNAYRDLSGPLFDWYVEQFSWLFLGPPGTLSPLHLDLFGTHAWLAQISGRKHFLLYSPEDRPYLYDGSFDPDAPDLERYPLLAKASPIEMVLEPGELVCIPRGWAHRVVSLTSSISLTFNFVCRSNLAAHVLEICRELPLWVRKIGHEGFREANRIRWRPADLAGDVRED